MAQLAGLSTQQDRLLREGHTPVEMCWILQANSARNQKNLGPGKGELILKDGPPWHPNGLDVLNVFDPNLQFHFKNDTICSQSDSPASFAAAQLVTRPWGGNSCSWCFWWRWRLIPGLLYRWCKTVRHAQQTYWPVLWNDMKGVIPQIWTHLFKCVHALQVYNTLNWQTLE